MLNSQSLIVHLKNIEGTVIENFNLTQVRQQYLRCNYKKNQLKIPIFFGYVVNFPRVSKFTGMCGALWKIYQ